MDMPQTPSVGNMVVPTVTQEDLDAFHTRVFGPSTGTIPTSFEAQHIGEEILDSYDDGLGYYEDGVKRTLTDEQIAMFRHSEIQALLRDRRHTRENKDAAIEGEEEGKEQALPDLVEEAGDVTEEDAEEDYARFLEEERRQMERDASTNKRKRSAEDISAVHGREATHRRTARELDVNFETTESLDYGEEPSHTTDRGTQERAPGLYERRRVDYADNTTGNQTTAEFDANDHVGGAPHGGKKIWWPKIGV